mgnify:CR=1 FL=1
MNHLSLCLLFIPYFLTAQQQAVWFERLGMDDGLSSPYVISLCRDSRGFLWIGTAGGGLNRYDGHEMKVYRRRENDSLSLCDDHINNIVEDSEGFLWLGTNDGVCRMNPANGKCRRFTRHNGKLRGGYGCRVMLDRKGRVWTGNHGNLEYFDSTEQRFIRHPAIDAAEVITLSDFDAGGRLWLGTLNGFIAFDPAAGTARRILFSPATSAAPQAEPESAGIHIDRFNNIWVATWGRGLLRYDPGRDKFEQFLWDPNPEFPFMSNIPAALEETFGPDSARSFWIAANGGLFKFRLDPETFPDLKQEYEFYNSRSQAGLPEDSYTTMLADREGNLWAGSAVNGVYRYNTRQENFLTLRKIKKGPINQIGFTRNGEAIVCGLEEPVVLLDKNLRRKKAFTRFSAQMSSADVRNSWEAVKDESSGILYIATLDGLVAWDERMNKIRLYRYNPKDSSGLFHRKISNVMPVGNDRVLLGLWKRPLQLFDARGGKNIKILSPNLIVRRLRKSADGRVWVCTESGLFRFDPVAEQLDTVIGAADVRFWDAHFDRRGRIWTGTNKGLWLFDPKSNRIIARYGVEQGLPGNSISGICEDSLGRLWLMTELGLCFFDPDTRQCHPVTQADGLFFKKIEYQMSQSPDGRVWLAYENHIQIFKPELVKTPQPSRVYITGLKINEKDTLPDIPFERIPEIRLRPGQNALTFSFTAIDLESFGKTNFLYRLDGLQTEWVRAGKNRTAAFVNLPAGQYTFRVRPEDAGAGDTFDAVLRVRVTDHFWQRAWFRALVLVLLGAFTVFAYNRWTNQRMRLRLADLERERALEELRVDIAQDIHDEVGSALTKIALSAQFAAMLPDQQEQDFREKLRRIGTEARNVALQLGEIVFAINPRYDRFAEVQAYFREKGREFLEEAQISSRFELPAAPGNPAVPPQVKRQLYMLYRECLNNIVKHAEARSVGIVFRLDENGRDYLLEIRDDGKGFDPEKTRQFGSGLKGMQMRAEKIGAALEIETGPGKGTAVRVRGKL